MRRDAQGANLPHTTTGTSATTSQATSQRDGLCTTKTTTHASPPVDPHQTSNGPRQQTQLLLLPSFRHLFSLICLTFTNVLLNYPPFLSPLCPSSSSPSSSLSFVLAVVHHAKVSSAACARNRHERTKKDLGNSDLLHTSNTNSENATDASPALRTCHVLCKCVCSTQQLSKEADALSKSPRKGSCSSGTSFAPTTPILRRCATPHESSRRWSFLRVFLQQWVQPLSRAALKCCAAPVRPWKSRTALLESKSHRNYFLSFNTTQGDGRQARSKASPTSSERLRRPLSSPHLRTLRSHVNFQQSRTMSHQPHRANFLPQPVRPLQPSL
eukprot:TRINITY_DN94_c0_g2_i1.p1 TRINITY_DN94_c0_g2~~TRINITY_DN94_c0_g2_i1.p1  ORF type:complete len:327 (-),score=14.03 TRINITY_DN94_c0_g2_i1:769-1749(-)